MNIYNQHHTLTDLIVAVRSFYTSSTYNEVKSGAMERSRDAGCVAYLIIYPIFTATNLRLLHRSYDPNHHRPLSLRAPPTIPPPPLYYVRMLLNSW